MSFFYDGQDPEYDSEVILNQTVTSLLNLRDLALLMRHSRFDAKSSTDNYSSNKIQLEIWFLEKIILFLDKELIHKFNCKDDNQQFHSQALSTDLGLNEIVPGKYFDKKSAWENRYETVKSIKIVFKNFNRAIDNDWKFL
jgi:hypothetical protein